MPIAKASIPLTTPSHGADTASVVLGVCCGGRYDIICSYVSKYDERYDKMHRIRAGGKCRGKGAAASSSGRRQREREAKGAGSG